MKRTFLRVVSALVIFVALLLVWVAIVKVFSIPAYMLPTPDRVAQAAATRFSSLKSRASCKPNRRMDSQCNWAIALAIFY